MQNQAGVEEYERLRRAYLEETGSVDEGSEARSSRGSIASDVELAAVERGGATSGASGSKKKKSAASLVYKEMPKSRARPKKPHEVGTIHHQI